jgi:hypothetical protein
MEEWELSFQIIRTRPWSCTVALVDILPEHLVKFPGSSIVMKWVEDFAKAASFQYISVGIPVS